MKGGAYPFDGCNMCHGAPDAPGLNDRGEPCPCRCHATVSRRGNGDTSRQSGSNGEQS